MGKIIGKIKDEIRFVTERDSRLEDLEKDEWRAKAKELGLLKGGKK